MRRASLLWLGLAAVGLGGVVTAPYECAGIDTTQVPDGLYEARAIATDGAGFRTTSAVVTNIRVDNTAPTTATLTNRANTLTGNVALSGTAADAVGVSAWIAQYSLAGAGGWTDACSDTVTPFTTCTWAIAAAGGDDEDARAALVSADGAVRIANSREGQALVRRRRDEPGRGRDGHGADRQQRR